MGTLDPADLGALAEELNRHLVKEDDLDWLLAVQIGKSLAEVAKPGTLPIRVLDTVRTADMQGWIGRLIHAAGQQWPRGPVLRRLLATIPAEHPPRTVAGDLSTYDMTGQLKLIRRAQLRSTSRLVAVVVADVGGEYLKRLYTRVVSELGASSRGKELKLDPVYKKGVDAAADVRRLAKTLVSKPVVVLIGVPPDCVGEVGPLVTELAHDSTKWAHHLVVIFAADASDIPALPATITPLDPPAIEEDDVIEWVGRLAVDFPGWPPALSNSLVTRIYEPARNRCDWKLLYQEMESVTEQLVDDFAGMVRAIDNGPNAA